MLNKYLSCVRTSCAQTMPLFFVYAVLILVLSLFSARPIRSMPPAPEKALSPDAAAAVTIWNVLPNQGLDKRVRALAITENDLYAGGLFTQTLDGTLTNLGGIARYNTVADTWSLLPNQGLDSEGSIPGEVIALVATDSDLFVGGSFSRTGDGSMLNLGNIAHFDITANTWNALPNQGLNGQIFALAVVGDDVYVGGTFTQTNDGAVSNLGGIARYDTAAGTWNALPNQSLNGFVYTLATAGSDLYVGGAFSQTGDGTVLDLNGIARYDTVANIWSALPNQGLDGYVTALTISGSDLYAGGEFTETNDGVMLNLGNIAHYDMVTDTWDALPNQGLNTQIDALAVVGTDLYVGGTFEQTGDGLVTNLAYIARYDSVTGDWNALPNQGLSDWVYAFATVDNHLYVGGNFSQTSDGAISLNRIVGLSIYENVLYLPLVTRD